MINQKEIKSTFVCKVYLKNKNELEQYIQDLCEQKKNPTLKDIKFDFQWGTIPV